MDQERPGSSAPVTLLLLGGYLAATIPPAWGGQCEVCHNSQAQQAADCFLCALFIYSCGC